ncbi:P-loop containing nucleoside triphosphate hydrolase protein [Favolaschia claudopus]|uniref:P-loop containing nucleoside triphosphate hydrolase protein n=1 Tax=Favolaschia claudopus TaxID=2862362 RepID=A0AAV9ZHX5_9AGAR
MYKFIERRRDKQRAVPMQVLALGFSRTGTTSMRIALKKLGYNETNHGFDVWANPLEMEMWTEAINAKFYGKGKLYGRAEWDQLLGDYMAVTDMPHILFAKELIEAYPEAKVILTTRNVDSWWKSYHDTIGSALNSLIRDITVRFDTTNARKAREFWHLASLAMFGTTNVTEEVAKKRYLEYYDEVRSFVPADRLLEYRVGEGWESLCQFLEKGVPTEPFPKTNDTKTFQNHMKRLTVSVWGRLVRQLAMPAFLVCCACFAFYYAGGIRIFI